jgi:hypothetical protein
MGADSLHWSSARTRGAIVIGVGVAKRQSQRRNKHLGSSRAARALPLRRASERSLAEPEDTRVGVDAVVCEHACQTAAPDKTQKHHATGRVARSA